MKLGDKIFIAVMVIILCLAGIFGLHEFGKNRNLNGINVIGEAKGSVKADDMTVYLQVLSTGKDSAQREKILNERLDMLKNLFTGNIIANNNYCYPENYETENCWFKNGNLGGWCKIGGICLHFTGDLDENIQYIKDNLSGHAEYVNTNNWTLMLSNNGESINEMKTLANQDAHQKAEAIANSLGVKLGKLLVYSENGFNGGVDYYYGDQIIQNFGGSGPMSFEIPYTARVYHTYAIK